MKKIIEKLGENRKNWLFSKAFLYSVTKIAGALLARDPSFIRFRYIFQTLRLFAALRLLELQPLPRCALLSFYEANIQIQK